MPRGLPPSRQRDHHSQTGCAYAQHAIPAPQSSEEEENVLMRTARRSYEPLLTWVMGHRSAAFALAIITGLLSGLLASRMGSEFVR